MLALVDADPELSAQRSLITTNPPHTSQLSIHPDTVLFSHLDLCKHQQLHATRITYFCGLGVNSEQAHWFYSAQHMISTNSDRV